MAASGSSSPPPAAGGVGGVGGGGVVGGGTTDSASSVVGEMMKQGHLRKNWKRRFFMLDVAGRQVTYYADAAMKKEKGHFSVVDAKVAALPVAPGRVTGGEQTCLKVKLAKPSGKDFVLECANQSERDEWIRVLSEAADGRPVSKNRRSVLSIDEASGIVRIDALLAEGDHTGGSFFQPSTTTTTTTTAAADVGAGGGGVVDTSSSSAAAAAGGAAGAAAFSPAATADGGAGAAAAAAAAAAADDGRGGAAGGAAAAGAAVRIARTGFLDKKGQVNTRWKSRWFTLSDAPGTDYINYYKHAGGLGQKGTIVIDIRHTTVAPATLSGRIALSIQTITRDGSSKTIYLAATTVADRDDWIHAIKSAQAVGAAEQRQRDLAGQA